MMANNIFFGGAETLTDRRWAAAWCGAAGPSGRRPPYILMAYTVMAYIAMVYIAMAYIYIAMAYIAKAYVVMAYIVMAYVVMAAGCGSGRPVRPTAGASRRSAVASRSPDFRFGPSPRADWVATFF